MCLGFHGFNLSEKLQEFQASCLIYLLAFSRVIEFFFALPLHTCKDTAGYSQKGVVC